MIQKADELKRLIHRLLYIDYNHLNSGLHTTCRSKAKFFGIEVYYIMEVCKLIRDKPLKTKHEETKNIVLLVHLGSLSHGVRRPQFLDSWTTGTAMRLGYLLLTG